MSMFRPPAKQEKAKLSPRQQIVRGVRPEVTPFPSLKEQGGNVAPKPPQGTTKKG